MGGSKADPAMFINWSLRVGTTATRCLTFNKFWPISRDLVFDIRILELWVVKEVFMKRRSVPNRDFLSTVVMWNRLGKTVCKEDDHKRADQRDCWIPDEANTVHDDNHSSRIQVLENEDNFVPSLTGTKNIDEELLMAIRNRLAGGPPFPGSLSYGTDTRRQRTDEETQYLNRVSTQLYTAQVDDRMVTALRNRGTSISHVNTSPRFTKAEPFPSLIKEAAQMQHSTVRMLREGERYQRTLPVEQNPQTIHSSSNRISQPNEYYEQYQQPSQPKQQSNGRIQHTHEGYQERLPVEVNPQMNYLPNENPHLEEQYLQLLQPRRNSFPNQVSPNSEIPGTISPSANSQLEEGEMGNRMRRDFNSLSLPGDPDYYELSSQQNSISRGIRGSIAEASAPPSQQIRELSWNSRRNMGAMLNYQKQIPAVPDNGDEYDDINSKPTGVNARSGASLRGGSIGGTSLREGSRGRDSLRERSRGRISQIEGSKGEVIPERSPTEGMLRQQLIYAAPNSGEHYDEQDSKPTNVDAKRGTSLTEGSSGGTSLTEGPRGRTSLRERSRARFSQREGSRGEAIRESAPTEGTLGQQQTYTPPNNGDYYDEPNPKPTDPSSSRNTQREGSRGESIRERSPLGGTVKQQHIYAALNNGDYYDDPIPKPTDPRSSRNSQRERTRGESLRELSSTGGTLTQQHIYAAPNNGDYYDEPNPKPTDPRLSRNSQREGTRGESITERSATVGTLRQQPIYATPNNGDFYNGTHPNPTDPSSSKNSPREVSRGESLRGRSLTAGTLRKQQIYATPNNGDYYDDLNSKPTSPPLNIGNTLREGSRGALPLKERSRGEIIQERSPTIGTVGLAEGSRERTQNLLGAWPVNQERSRSYLKDRSREHINQDVPHAVCLERPKISMKDRSRDHIIYHESYQKTTSNPSMPSTNGIREVSPLPVPPSSMSRSSRPPPSMLPPPGAVPPGYCIPLVPFCSESSSRVKCDRTPCLNERDRSLSPSISPLSLTPSPEREQAVLAMTRVGSTQMCQCGSRDLNLICGCKKDVAVVRKEEEVVNSGECTCQGNLGSDGEGKRNRRKKSEKEVKRRLKAERKRRETEEKRRKRAEAKRRKAEKEQEKRERKAREKERKKQSKRTHKKSRHRNKECGMCACCKCRDGEDTIVPIIPSETTDCTEKYKKKPKKEKKRKEKKKKRGKDSPTFISCECPQREGPVLVPVENSRISERVSEQPAILGFCNHPDVPCPGLGNRETVMLQNHQSGHAAARVSSGSGRTDCGDPVCPYSRRNQCHEPSPNREYHSPKPLRECGCSKLGGGCGGNICYTALVEQQPNAAALAAMNISGNSPTAKFRRSQQILRNGSISGADSPGITYSDIAAAPGMIFPTEMGHGDMPETIRQSNRSPSDPCSTSAPSGFPTNHNCLIDLTKRGRENCINKRYVPPCVLYLDCTKVKDLCVIIKDKYEEDPS